MTASDVKGAKTGEFNRIGSFKLDNTYTYLSVGSDSDKPTFTPTETSLQNVVKNTLLPKWSGLAAAVFRDQSGQLVDLYGYKNNGGCMTKDGFDAYFNMTASGNTKYKDETWSCYNLSDKLKQTWATHSGDPGWDQFTVSGIKKVSNLKEARKMVGQALYDCEGHKGLEADEFLGVDEKGETRLSSLDDESETIGYANLVSSVNCKGSSSDFDYVQFGIVFYDFDVVPVAAKGMKYINGKFETEENPAAENVSSVSNGQQQPIIHSADLGNDVKETTGISLSALASAKLDQNIGANISWSETQSGEDTTIGPDPFSKGGGISAETSGWSESTTMGLNWGAAWGLAGAGGAESGHSVENQISKSVATTVELPAHSTAAINHKTTKTTFSQSYQQPVIINYKVALFATSGDYYTGGSGAINPSRYDKQSLVIKFNIKDEANLSYGCAATDDLYSRVFTNKNIDEYDIADGRTYETHSTASNFSKSKDINWDNVISDARRCFSAQVEEVAKTNYFYETPGKLSVDQEKTTSAVDAIYPLYDLASIKTPKLKYKLHYNDTLNRESLTVEGLNKYGVSFYGFDAAWGEWNRCDKDGNVINGGNLLSDDPVSIENEDILVPVAGTKGGTIYLTWKIENPAAKPITGESANGQNLATSKISSPVVEIEVLNSGLDAPTVEVTDDSHVCFYKNPLALNAVFNCVVTDRTDKIISTQVKWESREYDGIEVDADRGVATFTRPGTYKVRPYVVDNENKKVVPKTEQEGYKWITVVASEHNLAYCAALSPTCTSGGYIEHYKCSDCGKFFSDPEGTKELSEQDTLIEPTGHAWGEWTTVREASGNTPGEQQRVCAHDASHVETRILKYHQVHFDVNGHGVTPDDQSVADGASVAVPAEPAEAGYAFDGWFADKSLTTPYDFGSAVSGDITLYAKWSGAKYTVAAMAVGKKTEVTDEGDGGVQMKLDPEVHGTLTINGGQPYTEDGYTASIIEVEPGSVVVLTATPDENYGLREIAASAAKEVPVAADSSAGSKAGISLGEPFVPSKTGADTYSFTMPNADVAVLASFDQVTVSYDGNKPADAPAVVVDVPKAEAIPYGSAPTKLDAKPTLEGYDFGGWFMDSACAQLCLKTSAFTENATLYAKWIRTGVVTYPVTYTLFYEPESPSDPGSYSESYAVEQGSYAYDPTDDLYAVAGKDLRAAYELMSSGDLCWFTDEKLTQPFNFKTTAINEDTHLYAKVVPRKYTVTYFSGSEKLGTQSVAYNEPIGKLGVPEPTRTGYTFSGWVTEGGTPWKIDTNPVTSDLNLYASWPVVKHSVKFDASGHGTAPETQVVETGAQATDPGALKADGYTFVGWFTDLKLADSAVYKFGTPVTGNLTLHAKWTKNAAPIITPATPAVKSAKSPLKNRVAVSWGAAKNADGYQVAIGSVTKDVSASARSVTIANTKLKAGGKYNVKVRAWHMNGTTKTYGKWSTAKKVTISKRYKAKIKKKVVALKQAKSGSIKVATLKKGATVTVLKEKGGWAKTNKGWVLKTYLKAVKTVNTAAVPTSDANPAAPSTSSGAASSLMAARVG